MDEKRMVGDYTVINFMYIGHREIILGENPKAASGERYVVFWAGVYKAICEIKNAPEEKVQIARTWLKAHGFSASIS